MKLGILGVDLVECPPPVAERKKRTMSAHRGPIVRTLTTLAGSGVLVALAALPLAAQSISYDGRSVSFNGSTVSGDWNDPRRDGGTFSASVDDLDLTPVRADDHSMMLLCAGGRQCVHGRVTRLNRVPIDSSLGPFDSDRVVVACESAAACSAFLRALRGETRSRAAAPSPPPASSRPAAVPEPAGTRSAVAPPPPPPPGPTREQLEANALLEQARLLNGAKLTSADCIALMSTYYSGTPPPVPAACQTELGRLSTYEQGRGPVSRPVVINLETIIDGSNIPSRIDFPAAPPSAIDRVVIGVTPSPSPAIPAAALDLDSAPKTPSTVPQATVTPVPIGSGFAPPSVPQTTSAADGGSNAMPSSAPEPSLFDRILDQFGALAPAPQSPMRTVGSPDDTVSGHVSDLDSATNGWNLANPLKYPLEILRVVNDKIERILDFRPLEEK